MCAVCVRVYSSLNKNRARPGVRARTMNGLYFDLNPIQLHIYYGICRRGRLNGVCSSLPPEEKSWILISKKSFFSFRFWSVRVSWVSIWPPFASTPNPRSLVRVEKSWICVICSWLFILPSSSSSFDSRRHDVSLVSSNCIIKHFSNERKSEKRGKKYWKNETRISVAKKKLWIETILSLHANDHYILVKNTIARETNERTNETSRIVVNVSCELCHYVWMTWYNSDDDKNR